MTKIRIEVVGESARRAVPNTAKRLHLALMLLFGVTLGALLGSTTMLPKIDPQRQLGGVAASGENNSIEAQTNTSLSDTQTTSIDQEISENTGVGETSTYTPAPSTEAQKIDQQKLKLRISDGEIAIARANEELARIKNESVSIISEFNTNCGNWKDGCAKPYAEKLEINNNTYNDLAQKITQLTRELEALHTEEASVR